MEVKLILYEGDLVKLEAIGQVSRDDWNAGHDPLGKQFGDSIYARTVLLSLANSHYLDSTGVEWLLTLHRRFKDKGGHLIIHSANAVMVQILQMMRMDRVLNLAKDELEARTLIHDHAYESPRAGNG